MCQIFLALFVIITFVLTVQINSSQVVVETESGKLKGKVINRSGKNFGVFLGVPYAKPPTGKLRFQPPQPLDENRKWDIVDATEFSKKCVETLYFPGIHSEDCLYLNVITPTIDNMDKEKYPVMVFVHGGGFVFGSASDYGADGPLNNFAARGVVYVSINYRLAAFGFFTTKSSVAPGNYGLLDQVEALRWVHKNIRAFGGDPEKVTIFGESAGGASVSMLTISPLTKGLFNQAILMSGSALSSIAVMLDDDPYDRSAILSRSLNCSSNDEDRESVCEPGEQCQTTKHHYHKRHGPECPLGKETKTVQDEDTVEKHKLELECLQSKTVEEIISQNEIKLGYAVRVDNNFLPEPPEKLIKKRTGLNLVIGVTKDEVATFQLSGLPGVPLPELVLTEKDYYATSDFFDVIAVSCKSFKYPGLVDVMARHHYAKVSSSDGFDNKHFWFTQAYKRKSGPPFWVPAYQDAVEGVKSKNKVFMYSFDFSDVVEFYNEEKDFYYKGATHASELDPLFDWQIDLFKNFSLDDGHPKSQRDKRFDRKMADLLGKLWTNFAKTGNPTPDDSLEEGLSWAGFNVQDANYLSIDAPKSQMKNNFHKDDLEFWTKYIPSLEDSVECQ